MPNIIALPSQFALNYHVTHVRINYELIIHNLQNLSTYLGY